MSPLHKRQKSAVTLTTAHLAKGASFLRERSRCMQFLDCIGNAWCGQLLHLGLSWRPFQVKVKIVDCCATLQSLASDGRRTLESRSLRRSDLFASQNVIAKLRKILIEVNLPPGEWSRIELIIPATSDRFPRPGRSIASGYWAEVAP